MCKWVSTAVFPVSVIIDTAWIGFLPWFWWRVLHMKRVISFLSEVRSYYFFRKRPVGRMFTKSININFINCANCNHINIFKLIKRHCHIQIDSTVHHILDYDSLSISLQCPSLYLLSFPTDFKYIRAMKKIFLLLWINGEQNLNLRV